MLSTQKNKQKSPSTLKKNSEKSCLHFKKCRILDLRHWPSINARFDGKKAELPALAVTEAVEGGRKSGIRGGEGSQEI